MSPRQATEFAKHYPTVVASYSDLPGTGFQATVFKDTAGMDTMGNLTLAIRGTENSGGDFVPTDADILTGGAAYDQIVAMVNWWKRASADPGTQVEQFRLVELPNAQIPEGAVVLRPGASMDTSYVLDVAVPVAAFTVAEGNISAALAADPDHRVEVAGHSTGGHLAMAFSTIFASDATGATVFNAPGFTDNETNQQFFLKLGGSIPAEGAANITNVIADEALSEQMPFSPIAGLHSRPGQPVNIAIENQWNSDEPAPFSALNHSIVILTDSLAVFNLLGGLDPAFSEIDPANPTSETNYKTILNNAAQGTAASYERVVDALQTLLTGDRALLPTGNGNRESLYQAIYDLQNDDAYKKYAGTLRIVPTFDTASAILQATQEATEPDAAVRLAYRYALAELNPFVVIDTNGTGLYDTVQAGLADYDAQSNRAGFTQSYLGDRADFLERKLFLAGDNLDENYRDLLTHTDPEPGTRAYDYQVQARHYADLGTGSLASTGVILDTLQHFEFGTERSDLLVGGMLDAGDHLYGGAGDDWLIGRYGDDYLEGGTGNDVYEYNASAGLLGSTNDGVDTILDADGEGVLLYTYTDGSGEHTSAIGGSMLATGSGTWQNADGHFTVAQDGADLVVTINGDAGGGLRLKDWREGDFGIRFVNAPSLPTGEVRTFLGDKAVWDSDGDPANGVQSLLDSFGNTILADGQDGRPDVDAADQADLFFGSDANEEERFVTGGGDDAVFTDRPNGQISAAGGVDTVDAGAGSDIVVAGVGDDWVEGGTGADLLVGNDGDDTLYAEWSGGGLITIDLAIAQGESGNARAGAGDLLSGDAGNDVLISDAGSDLLAGGLDNDIIVGGAGDDTIYGDVSITDAQRGWTVTRTRTDVGQTANFTVDKTGMTTAGDVPTGGADTIYGGAGADWIFAGAGPDYVEGGAGDDVIFGEAGSDVLLGGDGNDFLEGDSAAVDSAGLSGDDYLSGGAGNDELLGGNGNDVLDGGEGDDRLSGGEGDDTLYGGPGTDILDGGAGKDTYVYNRGDGVDVVTDPDISTDSQYLSALVLGPGVSRDQVKFRLGSLMVDFGAGDAIHFDGFNPNDPLSTPVLETIQFADGSAMSYQDVLNQGFDIDGTEGDDVIDGTAVTDRIDGMGGDDVITGQAGDDTILGGDGADTLDGGAGNDTLLGGAGDDTLLGGAGNDVMDGDDGADFLDGGTGDDALSGGAGSDSYLLYGGMGQDTATDGEGGETNVLQLGAGLTLENLYAVQVGDDLKVGMRGLEDAITLKDYFTRAQDWVVRDFAGTDTPLETVRATPDPYAGDFVAQLWRDAKLGQVARAIGTAYQIGWTPTGNALFQGFLSRAWLAHDEQTTVETFTRVDPPHDVLSSNTTQSVDDELLAFEGQAGLQFQLPLFGLETGSVASDAPVIYGEGLSLPSIVTSGQAVLTLARQLPLLNFQDTQYSNSGSVVSYDTGTETVLAAVTYDYDIQHYNQFAAVRAVTGDTSGWSAPVDQIVANRVLVNMTTAENRYLDVYEIFAGPSDNIISSNSVSDGAFAFDLITLVDGGAGNDTIYGRSGDLLYGNSGNDKLTASGATLIGGDGNDILVGEGNSRFVFTATEVGLDKVSETATYSERYLEWFYAAQGIADWRESSAHGGQYYVDGEGREYFNSLAEAQAAYPGWQIGYVEPLPFGTPVVRRDDATTIGVLAQAGVMPLDTVQFGPGLSLSDLELTLTVPGQIADAHPELPSYGGGTLAVRWGSGAGFNVTVPDVLYGVTASEITADSADGYRLGEGVELFQFANGNTYTLDQALQQATLVKLYGYAFARGSGSQVIDPGWGAVVFASDIDPSDVTAERVGTDLVFQLADASAEGRIVGWYADPAAVPQMSFAFADGTTFDTDTVTRLGLTQYGSAGSEYLAADPDFASALYGLGGGDFLAGGAGNDLLDSGGGGYMQGGPGNDIYVYARGYGNVRISDSIYDGAGGLDTVHFDASIAPQDVAVTERYGDITLTIDGGADQLVLDLWMCDPGGTIERFQFADGTVWDAATIEAALPMAVATEGDDLLEGTIGDDVLDGLGGNDQVIGYAGNDTLYGGTGDDYVEGDGGGDLLYGGDGNDDLEAYDGGSSLFDGGAGDDYIYDEGSAFVIGGAGDDWIDHYGDGGVIAFNPGDGNDTVYAAGDMTLSIGGGAQPADLSLATVDSPDVPGVSDFLISVGAIDSIRLTREWEADPAAWPSITLQMFGSVHTYDFNAVIADYEAQAAGDPNFVLSLDGVLQAHETATSAIDALGGAIAWQYATAGSTAALSIDDLRTVLSDPNFGLAAQPIALAPVNSAPTLDVPIADQTMNEDSAYSFALPAGTFSDPDAGDTLAYSASLADGSALPAWLSFNAGTQTFSGTPLQADVGAIDLRVTATDGGGLSADDSFTLNVANVNDAPVVSAADGELLLGDAVAAASLFSVADEDGDTPSQYEFWDDGSGGGYFSVNGVEQGAAAAIPVAAAELASVQYVAGSAPGTERVWVRAYDGQAWSAWKSWNLTSALHIPDAAPVTTHIAANQTVLLDATVVASTLFGVSDADGDPIASYQFWDDVAGGGYFSVNGVAQGAATAITVSAADLADTEYVGGSEAGAETVWVRATDGQTWGAWKSWTMWSWPHETNSAPIATAQDAEVLHGASVAASALFSVSDADGDSITKYEFWDDTAGGGYFSVGGVEQDNNPIPVDAAQLADVQYVGGANPGTEQVWVRAFDGLEWGGWKNWNMTTALHIPDAAPEVAPGATTQTVLLGQAVDAATLFAVSDADGDPIAGYEFFDSGDGGGYFSVNGVEQGVNVAIAVSATDLANTQFVGASASSSDLIWARATDGQSWSPWMSWTMNSWPHATNAAPVADASAGTVLQAEAVAASTLFSVSDADGDPVARYEFWDDGNGGGYFRVNGVQQASGQAIAVYAADLANTEYVGGANPGTEQVWVRANDGMSWGAWKNWNMTTALHLQDAAPIVTAPATQTLLLGQAAAAASFFSVSDADGDPVVQYELWDSTAGNGHFIVNGVDQGVNVSIPVSAADLANTQFVASSNTGSDQVWARASDGQLWSDWKSWSINSWPHATNSAPVATAQNSGLLNNEAMPVAMFFGTSDADGDPVTQYEFWDDVNGGGYFQVDGVQQASGQAIAVSAADLANTEYVGGATPGTEQVWVRASDGMAWGAWKNWLMSTEGGALRGGAGPDTLNGDPNTPILEGGGGDDSLTASDVNSLLAGDAGNDTLTGGAGSDLLAGGAGDDTIATGAGSNVIAFNAGGGVDTVYSAAGAQNTLSFGGGITYDDLSLSRTGNDLVVNVGQNDKMILKDWYAGSNNVLDLQIILDATNQFDANSSDPLYNKKVETFDFLGMVNEFDQALEQSPGLTSWAMTNALLQFHLTGSDDAALGGDLAYWYGRNAGFTGMSVTAAQQVLGDAGFGSDAQALHPFDGLQEGYVKLA